MQIFNFLADPLGKLLNFIYYNLAFNNYGIAIILFTIFIRLLILPLTIKQYRSSAKMQEIQPLIQEVQKKYKNDKEKMNQELMKVYQEHQYNPAGGCLPLLIQLPILLSLYTVISRPLKYMLQMSETTIAELIKKANLPNPNGYYKEIDAINFFTSNNQADVVQNLSMNFLGLNLGIIPSWNLSTIFNFSNLQYLALLIIPIMAVATTFISTKIAMPKTTEKTPASAMQNNMMYIGPIMTLIFSFQFPAALGLYWIVGNVIQIFQQLYINKYVLKKKEH